MAELPEAAQRSLAKAIAAYLRATSTTELPPDLAALKKTVQTPKSLARHRDRLLAVLEDAPLRALVLEWLEEGKPPLTKSEAAALKLAVERPQGWRDRLGEAVGGSKPAAKTSTSSDAEVRDLRAKLEREKEAHRKAREEVKRVKESGRVATKTERERSLRLDEEVTKLKSLMHERDSDLREARTVADRAQKEIERLKRKVRADSDRMKQQQRVLRDQNRDLKQKLQEATRAATEQRKAAAPRPKATSAAPKAPRPILKAPKGRFADAPETLEEWLATPNVTLVVDGYNVTHSGSGFGHLSLEQQRTRLRDLLKKLSNRVKVQTVLVWDGGIVEPGTKRLSSGYLTEEYSKPDRSGKGTDKDRADRHIVELVKKMPPHPVVVVTNDRGLQDEARTEQATIATSEQLLSLAR